MTSVATIADRAVSIEQAAQREESTAWETPARLKGAHAMAEAVRRLGWQLMVPGSPNGDLSCAGTVTQPGPA